MRPSWKLNATPLWFPQRKNLRLAKQQTCCHRTRCYLACALPEQRTEKRKAPPQNPGGNLISDCCFPCFFCGPGGDKKNEMRKRTKFRVLLKMKRLRVCGCWLLTHSDILGSKSLAKVATHAQTLGSERRSGRDIGRKPPSSRSLSRDTRPRALIRLFIKNSFASPHCCVKSVAFIAAWDHSPVCQVLHLPTTESHVCACDNLNLSRGKFTNPWCAESKRKIPQYTQTENKTGKVKLFRKSLVLVKSKLSYKCKISLSDVRK